MQSFTQNLESRKNSAISVELKDKEPVSRKSSLDQIRDDPNSSEHSSRKASLTDPTLTAYHQRKFEAEREYKVINQCSKTGLNLYKWSDKKDQNLFSQNKLQLDFSYFLLLSYGMASYAGGQQLYSNLKSNVHTDLLFLNTICLWYIKYRVLSLRFTYSSITNIICIWLMHFLT